MAGSADSSLKLRQSHPRIRTLVLGCGRANRPSATPIPSSRNNRCVSAILAGPGLVQASLTAAATATAGAKGGGGTGGALGGAKFPPVRNAAIAKAPAEETRSAAFAGA